MIPTATQRPTSPAFSEATTRASMMPDLDGKIITRADLRTSLQSYDQLLSASASYRAALLNLSQAAASFAEAIQCCANLKGCSFVTAKLQGASSGFHHLLANHLHVLSDAVDRKLERPLKYKLAEYRSNISQRSEAYENALKERSTIIRQTEERNMRMGRRKERDMASFRSALAILQAQVDGIDRLKADHYREVEQHEEDFSDMVHGKVSIVVRSTFEVFERVTAKSTDPVLEPMLQAIPDPFDSYGEPKAEGEIFSVLRPLGILSEASIPSTPRDTDGRSSGPPWVGISSDVTTHPQNEETRPSQERSLTTTEREIHDTRSDSTEDGDGSLRDVGVEQPSVDGNISSGAAQSPFGVVFGQDLGGGSAWETNSETTGTIGSGNSTIKTSRWRMRLPKSS